VHLLHITEAAKTVIPPLEERVRYYTVIPVLWAPGPLGFWGPIGTRGTWGQGKTKNVLEVWRLGIKPKPACAYNTACETKQQCKKHGNNTLRYSNLAWKPGFHVQFCYQQTRN